MCNSYDVLLSMLQCEVIQCILRKSNLLTADNKMDKAAWKANAEQQLSSDWNSAIATVIATCDADTTSDDCEARKYSNCLRDKLFLVGYQFCFFLEASKLFKQGRSQLCNEKFQSNFFYLLHCLIYLLPWWTFSPYVCDLKWGSHAYGECRWWIIKWRPLRSDLLSAFLIGLENIGGFSTENASKI